MTDVIVRSEWASPTLKPGKEFTTRVVKGDRIDGWDCSVGNVASMFYEEDEDAPAGRTPRLLGKVKILRVFLEDGWVCMKMLYLERKEW